MKVLTTFLYRLNFVIELYNSYFPNQQNLDKFGDLKKYK